MILEDNKTLLVQPRDPKNRSRFTGMNNQGSTLSFMIAPIQNTARYDGGLWTHGFYNLTSATSNLRAYDLRAYSSLSLQLWEGGKLVEDNTHDYLTQAESTMPGVPIGMNRVRSAAELTSAAKASQGLTHVTLPSLDLLWTWGLGWNSQYAKYLS